MLRVPNLELSCNIKKFRSFSRKINNKGIDFELNLGILKEVKVKINFFDAQNWDE